jgi:NADH:ubiquinone reductase (H+-translocating)
MHSSLFSVFSRPIFQGTGPSSLPPKKKVVIIGNGLGGVAAGRELNRLLKKNPNLAEVTLVGPQDQFMFKPQLHETLNGQKVTVSMESLFPSKSALVQFKKAEVSEVSIDPANKSLKTTAGNIPFDYLIIAVGGKTAYYGHDASAKSFAIPIETLNDLDKIKQSALKKLAVAANAPLHSEAQKNALSFVVVGGGATGVEFAFELNQFVKDTIRKQYPQLANQKPSITIVEAMGDILNGFGEKEKNYVKKRLAEKGIQVLYNHPVKLLNQDGLTLLDKNSPASATTAPPEKTIKTQEPIWVTGVKANPLVESLPIEKFPGSNRVKVNPFLEVPGRPDIYVIGDASGALDSKTQKPLPPTGQVAEQEGYFVAKDLVAQKLTLGSKPGASAPEKRPVFEFNNQGTMFSLGSGDGFVSPTKGFFMKGAIARYLRSAVYYKKAHYP